MMLKDSDVVCLASKQLDTEEHEELEQYSSLKTQLNPLGFVSILSLKLHNILVRREVCDVTSLIRIASLGTL